MNWNNWFKKISNMKRFTYWIRRLSSNEFAASKSIPIGNSLSIS